MPPFNIPAQKLHQPELKDPNVLRNGEEIARLRTKLGLPPITPPYNLSKSRAMLEVLRDMAAHNAPVAVAVAATAPNVAATVETHTKLDAGLTASLAEFYKMDSTTRTQFATDGGALAKSDFDKLTLTAKSRFCVAGGKILDDTPATSRNLSTAARSFGNS